MIPYVIAKKPTRQLLSTFREQDACNCSMSVVMLAGPGVLPDAIGFGVVIIGAMSFENRVAT